MSIALIAIPHQLPAKIHWYTDRDSLQNAASEHAMESDDHEPWDFESAVRTLADDWSSWLLVESSADLADVRSYTGHQEHKVRSMVDELRAEYLDPDSLSANDKRTLGRLSTTNSAGRHFTETHSADWLGDMEQAGWIWVDRPIHQTGIMYDPDQWTVSVDEEVPEWFDANGDLME